MLRVVSRLIFFIKSNRQKVKRNDHLDICWVRRISENSLTKLEKSVNIMNHTVEYYPYITSILIIRRFLHSIPLTESSNYSNQSLVKDFFLILAYMQHYFLWMEPQFSNWKVVNLLCLCDRQLFKYGLVGSFAQGMLELHIKGTSIWKPDRMVSNYKKWFIWIV